MVIKPTKRGFEITRTPCVVCGEPPFGNEYCCGHPQTTKERLDRIKRLPYSDLDPVEERALNDDQAS
jgi:hypothetical protein